MDRVRTIGRSARSDLLPARGLALVLLALILASTVRIGSTIPDEAQEKDARGYVNTAANIARYGVFGVGDERTMDYAPLLSATIAGALRLDPRHADFRAGGEITDHRAVRQVNLLFIVPLQVGLVAIVFLLFGTGRRGAALAITVLVVHHVFLLEHPDFTLYSLQELPAAAAMTWASVAAIRLTRGMSPAWAMALGMFGGLLTLTRSVFLYVFPVFLLLVVLLVRSSPSQRARALAAGMAGLTLVAGPWLARNVVLFDEFAVSDAGAQVLLMRDVKNGMDGYQRRGAWVHFSPDPLRPPLARLLSVDLDDFLDDGPLRPLVRWLEDPETGEDLERIERRSFYREARDIYAAFVAEGRSEGLSREQAERRADSLTYRMILDNVRQDPLRFPRTTPIFLYRSMWTLDLSQLWDPTGVTVPRITMALLNVTGMITVLVGGALGLLRRRPVWFALTGLPIGMIAYHALFTHALARYTRPAAPAMILCTVLAAAVILDRVRDRSDARTAAAVD